MKVARRNFLRVGLWMGASGFRALPVFEQQGPARTLHPPEPAGPLVILQPEHRVSLPPAAPQKRYQEFRNGLQQLRDCADHLLNDIGEAEIKEVFSVGVYKQTQLLESLAKHLKTLAKS